MKPFIAFDAKRLAGNRTGLGNYARYVVDACMEHNTEFDMMLMVPNAYKKSTFIKDYTDKPCTIIYYPDFFGIGRSVVMESYLPKRKGLLHGLSNEIPFQNNRKDIKRVVTIHDIIHKHRPKDFAALDRFFYGIKTKHAIQHADLIIAISEYTKQDLITTYNADHTRIDVVYQQCNQQYFVSATDVQKQQIKTQWNLPQEFVLYVGSLNKRKNVESILQAIASLDNKSHFICIGKGSELLHLQKLARNLKIQDYCIFLTDIQDEQLPVFYQLASMVIYPSKYEGFGIPILEAQASGAPIIVYDYSCMAEVGGIGALIVDPILPNGLVKAIQKLRFDKQYRQDLVEKGYRNLQRFDRKENALKLMTHYRNLLS